MSFKTIIFDLDGVLYLGDSIINGAPETIEKIKKMNKSVFFLTNSGTSSREDKAIKLRNKGFLVENSEVFTSAYGVGHYIASIKSNPTVYIVGEGSLREQLASFGIFSTTENPDFVVVSLDREISYSRLSIAFRNIINGSKFIATNDDKSYPIEDGFLPGAGAIVHAISYSTGVKPIVIGKPNSYLMELIYKECHCKKSEILLVGDRIETDIKVAKEFGIKSALVLTGVSKKEDVSKLKEREKPDYLLHSVNDVLKLL